MYRSLIQNKETPTCRRKWNSVYPNENGTYQCFRMYKRYLHTMVLKETYSYNFTYKLRTLYDEYM